MDSLTFLNRKLKDDAPPILVVHGNDAFLRRQVIQKIRHWVLGDDPDDFSFALHNGEKADLSEVKGDAETKSFFGGQRLVLVENADPFVSANRSSLEKYFTSPSDSGVLVLEVKTWTASTKLAKMLDKNATITCKAPSANKLVEWVQEWSVKQYQKGIIPQAARLLIDLTGSEMGLLDQELAKLSVYIGDREKITVEDVDVLVGNNRSEKTFRIFELIGNAKEKEALTFLDQLLTQGEDPLRLLGAFGWHLRRLAQAARLSTEGTALTKAIKDVGLFDINSANQQLRHLGFRRINQLYDWLLEVDLGIKGDSTLSPRAQLERLIIRLARPMKP